MDTLLRDTVGGFTAFFRGGLSGIPCEGFDPDDSDEGSEEAPVFYVLPFWPSSRTVRYATFAGLLAGLFDLVEALTFLWSSQEGASAVWLYVHYAAVPLVVGAGIFLLLAAIRIRTFGSEYTSWRREQARGRIRIASALIFPGAFIFGVLVIRLIT